jgi:hypothetical protein
VGLAGAVALPAGAAEVDPIFAVIAEHRAAIEAWCQACNGAADAPDAAKDRENDAHWAVLTMQPTTLAGVAALLDHVGHGQFLGTIEDDDGETVLSINIHQDEECPFKRAAQEFPARLAETMCGLLGA